MARSGRPRGFDRDAALDSAMHLFWEHGYEGASLLALRQAMGDISSASFYAAFGSKEALYRETLTRYLAVHGGIVGALDDETLSPRSRLEQALIASVAVQTDPAHPKGCMMTLSAIVSSEAGAPTRTGDAAGGEGTSRIAAPWERRGTTDACDPRAFGASGRRACRNATREKGAPRAGMSGSSWPAMFFIAY